MASRSKKKGSKKTSGRKQTQSFLKDEILIWLTLAVSILMLVSLFGFGGFIGGTFSDILFLVFGLAAYVIPFLLFGGVTFLVSNRENRQAYIKTGAWILLLILACTFLELVDKKGGFLGQGLAGVLTPAIGTAGTYVAVIILMIICMVIITGKSALKGVKSQSGKAYDKAKRDAARLKERTQAIRTDEIRRRAGEIQDKKSQKRRDRHVEGVSFDTTLKKNRRMYGW